MIIIPYRRRSFKAGAEDGTHLYDSFTAESAVIPLPVKKSLLPRNTRIKGGTQNARQLRHRGCRANRFLFMIIGWTGIPARGLPPLFRASISIAAIAAPGLTDHYLFLRVF